MKILFTSLIAALAISYTAPAVEIMARSPQLAPAPQAETSEIIWTDVTLESAGSLGVEILYKVDKLSDVRNLRVKGPLNDQDWATMKNMAAVNIDLSGATASSIPAETFNGKSYMTSFLFPRGVKSVGYKCFYQTGLTEIVVPETVTSAGDQCFYQCKNMLSVDWKAQANIPAHAFYYCTNLTSVSIAEGVKSIAEHAFYNCEKLAALSLPSTLQSISQYAIYDCKALGEVVLPENLQRIDQYAIAYCALSKVVVPDAVSSLGSNAFTGNTPLSEVVLPSGIFSYSNSQFSGCPNIVKVTCRAATPPAVLSGNYNYPPFDNAIRANCALYVPDFSVVDYKLHDYWHNFASIEGGVQSDRWILASALSLTNDRRMDGTPSITIAAGGSLNVGGSAPMPMENLTVFQDLRESYRSFGQLINNTPAMTAKSGSLYLYTYSNRWYFITMPCDVKVSALTHTAGADFVFRYYDGESRAANGSGANWKNVPADGTLEAGKAYICQSSKEGHILMPLDANGIAGLLSNAHRVTPVKAWSSEYAAHSGWNFIGNPWLAYFDLAYTGLTCPVTIWDDSSSKYTAYSLIDDDVVLQPMQAFFMQQPDADAEVLFDIKGRQFTSQVARPGVALAANAPAAGRAVFNIEINGVDGLSADRMRIVLNNDASEAYEMERDASKFFSPESQCPELFSVDSEGNYLAINERPCPEGSIPMGVYTPSAGRFTIHATRADGNVRLYDAEAGRYADLASGENYSFEASSKGYILNRFYLDLDPSTTQVDSIEAAGNAETEIYTLDGLRLPEGVAPAKGIYIVKEGNKVSKKIFR